MLDHALSFLKGGHQSGRPSHFQTMFNVLVYEGFALYKQGDLGLAESFTVIARSFDILTAIEPTQDHGFFYNAMVKTMTNFCTDPPP